jgi:Flp pilus assembly protein TadB
MGWFVLFLVLVAVAFGVLGAVIKATVFIVLTILFTLVALTLIAVFAFRHQANRFRRDFERRLPQ